jgi:hypothetical protein
MPMTFIEAFEAELQLYAWPPDHIADLVAQTKNLLARRLSPWEFPFTRSPGSTQQSFLDSIAPLR